MKSMIKNFTNKALSLLALITFIGYQAMAQQTVVSGNVTDGDEALIGVNIIVKGKVTGTISDTQGNFKLSVSSPPPITLVFSIVGYETQEIDITSENVSGLNISMSESVLMGQEVVVSASRVEESFLESPVTVERVDILAIQQAPTANFYETLANVKGVAVNSGSLNFPSVNTRGFATIANVRFVQLVDGMDSSAPLLNFPTGNLVGMSELDAEGMELVPGAASALYGPNAFNGILLMTSKSPFEYQGLSAQYKTGITTSDAQNNETYGMNSFSVRYAKAFNNKFAFKVNFSYSDAQDWVGNDYTTDRFRSDSKIDLTGEPNFDGLNLYGDETQIVVPMAAAGPQYAGLGVLDLRRTGLKEEDLMDDYVAENLKYDVALHYRVTDDIEAIGVYRRGQGSSIYQGAEKYALRDFSQTFYKLELKADNFFVRGYHSVTDDGDSWNASALGGFTNEAFANSVEQWVPDYLQAYLLTIQGYGSNFTGGPTPAGNEDVAHDVARAYADRNIPAPGTQAFQSAVEGVRNGLFQRNPPGAGFEDNSKLWHGEFNYNFKNQITAVELQVGGNFRRYDLFSNGTIFNEGPDDGINFERIGINEFGFYGQVGKRLAQDKLKLTASLRFDKNENFDGQVTPRVSAVYSASETQNFRASFQTGFRNPDTQAQFIYFPSSAGTLVGSVEENAARYGIHNGGAYTEDSYQAYIASGGSLAADGTPTGGNPSVLETANVPYAQPEQLTSFEIGYKGVISNKLLLDVNYYNTTYTDFLGSENIRSKNPTQHQGNTIAAGSPWRPYVNSPETINSYGFGVGATWSWFDNFTLSGNYSYADFDVERVAGRDFIAGFNTPNNRFSVTVANRQLFDNFGFSASFRWQEEFMWQSSFGDWLVPEFGVFDAQVNYKIESIKTIVKVGGQNIGGGDYRTNAGAPFVGQQYYISITFDEFLN
ncbi:MAG: TonB-dependent receptor [Cyclobacteriaceae bacterium]